MTEYDVENRQAKMVGEHELSSHDSSTSSSSVNMDLSREASTVGNIELSNEQQELSSSSNPTSNESNQSFPSDTQPSSKEPPLQPSTDTDNNVPTTSSSTEPLAPPSGSSFAQLAFQKFETYISETRADQIAPLQEIICGYGVDLARFAQSTHNQLQNSANTPWQPQEQQHPHPQQGQFLEPIALRRHIHSTPLLRQTPNNSTLPVINDEDESDFDSDEDSYPPPAGLEILDFTRSRSTPLTTSENSAFGTILRTSSHSVLNGCTNKNQGGNFGGSAFSLQPYAMKKAKSRSDERAARPVIFNPIVHEDEILKTVDGENPCGEMTSIEVTNVPLPKEEQEKRRPKKKNTVSRTAKFLTDVRNLRITSGNGSKRLNGGGSGRRNRRRDGRENPARPPSLSSDSSAAGSNNTTERNDMVRPVIVAISTGLSPTSGTSIERTTTSPDATEKAMAETSSGNDRVCIQVNDHAGNSIDVGSRQRYSMSSLDPSEVLDQTDQSYSSNSRDSPNSTRFPPSISNSSGRASYGTSTSSNGHSHGSHLSSISETDREVANVNLLQRDRRLQIVGEQIELSLSSDRSSSIRSGDLNGSVSIASPDSNIRRDGASVRADRFFNYKDSNRLRHLPRFTMRSGSAQSPIAGSSSVASMTTNSSCASDEPPKIVSYMDRKQISDLSSLHHRQYPFETSSPRADHDQEVRDSSPSEQILSEHSEIIFEGAHPAQLDVCNRPRPTWPGRSIPTVFVRKNRSLPPRSPCNNSLTPPPRVGSPAYNAISPPRQFVGHRIDPLSTNLSKPYVVAPTSYRSNSKKAISATLSVPVTDINCALLPDADQVPYDEAVRLSPNCDYYNLKPEARGLSPIPVYGQQGARAYEESSIEIMKSDSKDDNVIPLVTPDKGNPPP